MGIKESLKSLGYGSADDEGKELEALECPDRASMKKPLDLLADKAQPEEHLVAFYAGHGMQRGILGTGATVTVEIGKAKISDEHVYEKQQFASVVSRAKSAGAHIRVIIDACHSGSIVEEVLAGRASDLIDKLDPKDPLFDQIEIIACAMTDLMDRINSIREKSKGPEEEGGSGDPTREDMERTLDTKEDVYKNWFQKDKRWKEKLKKYGEKMTYEEVFEAGAQFQADFHSYKYQEMKDLKDFYDEKKGKDAPGFEQILQNILEVTKGFKPKFAYSPKACGIDENTWSKTDINDWKKHIKKCKNVLKIAGAFEYQVLKYLYSDQKAKTTKNPSAKRSSYRKIFGSKTSNYGLLDEFDKITDMLAELKAVAGLPGLTLNTGKTLAFHNQTGLLRAILTMEGSLVNFMAGRLRAQPTPVKQVIT